jgi:hypothetical protein
MWIVLENVRDVDGMICYFVGEEKSEMRLIGFSKYRRSVCMGEIGQIGQIVML